MTIRAGVYVRISLDWEGEGKGVARQLDAVVMWMEDRLQRQVIELAEFLKVCDQAGVTRIASVGGELNLADPDQRTMLYIKAAMAEAEIEKMRTRMRRKHLESAKEGERALGGLRPFGEAWHGKQAVSEEQASQERELIREAARRIIAGDSLRGIVTEWQRRGITSQRGNAWHNVNLRRMLLSPRLIGVRRHHGEMHPGRWEPILDRETWEAVKAILEDPARSTHERGGLPKHLLSGLIYCGPCGVKLSVRKIRGKRVYYCSPLPPRSGCGKISRQADPIEELITGAIFTALESDLYARLSKQDEADSTGPLYEQLAHDQGLLDRLEDKVAQDLISAATAKRNRAGIERRMEAARREISQRRGGQVLVQVPCNLRDVWSSLSLDRRRNIVKAVLLRVVVLPQAGGSREFHPDKIHAEWRV